MTYPRASKPAVVISIDLEMRWGRHDRLGLEGNGRDSEFLDGIAAVPDILRAFSSRGLRATWAAVGAIGCENWGEYFRLAPPPPRYDDPRLAIKSAYADLDPQGRLHFSPGTLALIATTPGQDLGTHTFSHLYLREPGVTKDDFKADLSAAAKISEMRIGRRPRSLVFPRNQANFVDELPAAGIKVWRGNPVAWYYDRNESRNNKPLPRAWRYLDSVVPVSRVASAPEGDMCRASAFVRFDLPELLWRLHQRRLMREIGSARAGETMHLWFHEHNLGRDTELRLRRLRELCDQVAEHIVGGKLASCNMLDLVGTHEPVH
jgi:peptidoglycan/xylan/chitin deacetylase (PgdA/CDA1 family)